MSYLNKEIKAMHKLKLKLLVLNWPSTLRAFLKHSPEPIRYGTGNFCDI
jgi:hypothetical protein